MVAAVVPADPCVPATRQAALGASTRNRIYENRFRSTAEANEGRDDSMEAQLPASHTGVRHPPVIVTNSAPPTVQENLQSTLGMRVSTDQAKLTFGEEKVAYYSTDKIQGYSSSTTIV